MNKLLCAFIFFLGFQLSSYAWGPRGHKIVTQIAKKYMDPAVLDSVEKYLDDISMEKASYWMDEVVMNSSYDFMQPWHYVAIEVDKTYVKSKKPDVVNVLENVVRTILDKKTTRKELFLSLKVLIHLVGDIHQPLHCGFAKDEGGEKIKLRFFFKTTSLHQVWDAEVLEYQGVTAEECLRTASNFTKRDVNNYKKTDILKWMEESRELLSYVYDFKGNKLGDEYVDKVSPIIKMQLIKAGLRLAEILNQRFS